MKNQDDGLHSSGALQRAIGVMCGCFLLASVMVWGSAPVSAHDPLPPSDGNATAQVRGKTPAGIGLRVRDKDFQAKVGKKRVFVAQRHDEQADKRIRLQRVKVTDTKPKKTKWRLVKSRRSSDGGTARFGVRTRKGTHAYRVVTRVDGNRKTSHKVPFRSMNSLTSSACSGKGYMNFCVSVDNNAVRYSAPNELVPVGYNHDKQSIDQGCMATASGGKATPPDIPAGTPGTQKWQYRDCAAGPFSPWNGISASETYLVDSEKIPVIPADDGVTMSVTEQWWAGSKDKASCETDNSSYSRCLLTESPTSGGWNVAAKFSVTTLPTTVAISNNLQGQGDANSSVTLTGSPTLNAFVSDPKGQSANIDNLAQGKTGYFGLYRTNGNGNSFAATYKTAESGPFGGGQFVVSVVIDKDTMNKDLSTCKYQQANTMSASCDLAVAGTGADLTVTLNFHS